ncbi:MAG TPA: galactitol-1-phosphate 5-dehydrogenase [Bryobacteraceae bacterium]|jgi:L-iditol 2-dehydrogenase|nr:galactitol-1-phosphate 5-dehydrogenase [Bryobacteraceae bacterium]
MKALLLSEYKHLALTDMPEPEIGPEEVLIRVKACGICGSDVHGYDGSTGRRIPPIVMGHEAAGTIAEVGRNVKDLVEGDRVTFDSTVFCGHCFFCRRGQANLCDHREVLGVSCDDYRRAGAFAEYVAVPRRICYRLPPELPFSHAAMIEAIGVAVHAVSLTPIQINDTAVVMGAGMIGLLTLQAAKLAGCGRVISVDVDDTRLEAARKLGATHTVNAKALDTPEHVKALTEGRGADVAIECVGATATIQNSIASVRKGGTVTLVGNITPNIELPLQSVVARQIRVQGSCASSGEYPACIDLLSRGAIRVEPMISATAPLDKGPEWFERLYRGEPNLMKVVLEP